MVMRRLLLPLALFALALPPRQAAAQQDPRAFCARAGTDDATRPIPPSLVDAARRLFELRGGPELVRRTTVFRCAEGAVLLCNTGANLPCGKANTSRDLPGAASWCRDNPRADMIPMFATGHDTIYRWRCRNGRPVAEGPAEEVDARGFLARLWKRVD